MWLRGRKEAVLRQTSGSLWLLWPVRPLLRQWTVPDRLRMVTAPPGRRLWVCVCAPRGPRCPPHPALQQTEGWHCHELQPVPQRGAARPPARGVTCGEGRAATGHGTPWCGQAGLLSLTSDWRAKREIPFKVLSPAAAGPQETRLRACFPGRRCRRLGPRAPLPPAQTALTPAAHTQP